MEENNVNTCCEYILYSIIQSLGGIRWRIAHDAADGRIPDDQNVSRSLEELTEKLEAAVDQTARFGVETPVRPEGQANQSYWLWYRKWNDWVESLSDDEFNRLDAVIESDLGDHISPGMDVSEDTIEEMVRSGHQETSGVSDESSEAART
jgi:hypothetical protein